MRRARERREEAEAAKAAEAAAKEAAKEAAKAAAAAKREAAAQAKRKAAEEAKQKAAKAIKTVVEDATVATPPAPAPAAVGVPTAHETAECERLGFTPEAIAYSNNVDELGPRGTLSNEGRILRWCEVLTSDARYDVGEANRDDYFKSKVWMPVAEQAHLRYAKSLNERAALASWGA